MIIAKKTTQSTDQLHMYTISCHCLYTFILFVSSNHLIINIIRALSLAVSHSSLSHIYIFMYKSIVVPVMQYMTTSRHQLRHQK